MGRSVLSMKGREVDIDALTIKQELTPAIGNMKVNARGDEIGVGGKIVKTREQILEEYYKNNPRKTVTSDDQMTLLYDKETLPNVGDVVTKVDIKENLASIEFESGKLLLVFMNSKPNINTFIKTEGINE